MQSIFKKVGELRYSLYVFLIAHEYIRNINGILNKLIVSYAEMIKTYFHDFNINVLAVVA